MELIGECKGNNGNGCFMDSCGHDCGCFVRKLKHETLEEAAKNYIYKPQNNDYGDYNSFIAGAKWQQERSYSEEEVIKFGQWLSEFNNLDNESEYVIKELLKRFKNKKDYETNKKGN